MVRNIKNWFDLRFPFSPEGFVYWRDRIVSGIKAAGVFLLGLIGYLIDQLYAALPQVKAYIAPYVGPVGVWIAGAVIIYLAENYFRKRMPPPPQYGGNYYPPTSSPQYGQQVPQNPPQQIPTVGSSSPFPIQLPPSSPPNPPKV